MFASAGRSRSGRAAETALARFGDLDALAELDAQLLAPLPPGVSGNDPELAPWIAAAQRVLDAGVERLLPSVCDLYLRTPPGHPGPTYLRFWTELAVIRLAAQRRPVPPAGERALDLCRARLRRPDAELPTEPAPAALDPVFWSSFSAVSL